MRTLRCTYLALLSLTLLPCGLMAGNYAFGDLAGTAQIDGAITAPAASAPAPGQQADARQDIPPNNNEPGYNWPGADKSMQDWHFLRVSTTATYLKASSADTAALQDGTGKCKLDANTLYSLYSLPAFEGRHIVAHFLTPLPGCSFSRGYVYMPDVHSTSAGGKGLLPVNVRAFLDTLAFAEGTNEHYNYIYTFVTFTSYAKHPRKKICSGGLCSTAAGRYQFLTATWDALAADLALPDFTPPSQEKAALELLRRTGSYPAVERSSTYANFAKAMTKNNTIWASLPGSPYGQPTYTVKELWAVYSAILKGYLAEIPPVIPAAQPTLRDFLCVPPTF